MTIGYPYTQKKTSYNIYHGCEINDPYSWMENINDQNVIDWIDKQNKLTDQYFKELDNHKFKKRYKDLLSYPRHSSPYRIGEYIFSLINYGLYEYSKLHYKKIHEDNFKPFFEDSFLKDKCVNVLGFSSDNKYIVCNYSKNGAGEHNIFIVNIKTKKILNDNLKNSRFASICWYKNGFFYTGYSKNIQKIYYHKLNTIQSEDILIFDNNNPNNILWLNIYNNNLILYQNDGIGGYLNCLYSPLKNDSYNFNKIISGKGIFFNIININNNKVLALTNINAPNRRLVKFDLNKPKKNTWKDIIPEKKDILISVNFGGKNKIIAKYLHNAYHKLYSYDIDGKNQNEITLPDKGSIININSKVNEQTFYYTYTSFLQPITVYEYNFNSDKSKVIFLPKIDFNFEQYEVKQRKYKSKDGTLISIYLIHNKNIELNKLNPVFITGYGGFNHIISPSFSINKLILLENNSIIAIPNIRGGGEYGKKWHEEGKLLKKQNSFNDFIFSAKYLIDYKYTSPCKIAIAGESNGGLLIGTCINQSPELFNVAIIKNGILDMLKYHKFLTGWAWTNEYGCIENKEHFNYLKSYSPIHNIKKNKNNPSIFVIASKKDSRVLPAHSYKYVAYQQEINQNESNIILRCSNNTDHSNNPLSTIINEQIEIISFFLHNTKNDNIL